MSNETKPAAGKEKQKTVKAPAKKEVLEKNKPAAEGKAESMIAIVRVRGGIRAKKNITSTLDMLRLYRVNYCVVHKKTPSIMGMVRKAKDYITWGELDEETNKMLVVTRGKQDPENKDSLKPYFALNPPKKGFGRGGIKKPFSKAGAVGNRGAKINDLIKRML